MRKADRALTREQVRQEYIDHTEYGRRTGAVPGLSRSGTGRLAHIPAIPVILVFQLLVSRMYVELSFHTGESGFHTGQAVAHVGQASGQVAEIGP